VYSGGPTSHFTADTGYKTRKASELTNILPAADVPITGAHQQVYEHCMDNAAHRCPECRSVFRGRRTLAYHIKTKHTHSRLVCPQCQCSFASKPGLVQHVRHIHEKLSRYRCDTCGKGYSIRSHYYDHIATHTGVKRNVCSICLKQFTFKTALNVHMLRFHSDRN